ncbi:MAG: 50S ribosomal protein L1 [Patescibacteria group bacterium]
MNKKREEAQKLVDPKKTYSIDEGIELAKKSSTAKFDESIDLHIKLGINTAKSDQQVRGTVILPHHTGKSKKVAAFVSADKQKDAAEAGAEIVGGEELIAVIAKTGKCDFDVAVATPDMMPKLAKVAKILGPKGLMPNPKTETVGPNVKKMIEEVKRGKVTFKNDDTGNIHQQIGKVSLDSAKIKENLRVVMDAVKKSKPAGAKGAYIQGAYLAASMGPSVKISI